MAVTVSGALFTTSVVVAEVALKLPEAAWLAVMVVEPALSIVTRPLLMVATVGSATV